MTQLTECPPIDELAGFTKTGDVSVETHVFGCRRCQALLRLLEQRETAGAEELTPRELPVAQVPKRTSPDGDLAFGEVCVIDSDFSRGALVVAVVIDEVQEMLEAIEVAPISTEIVNASDFDLVLAPEDGPLGYPAMVELWNHGTVLANQVVERFGLLVVDGLHRLSAMYEALLADEAPPADVPRGVPVIADEDPRALFQEEEAERVRPFWQPAARALAEKAPTAAASVGVLLGQWLEHHGYEPADLAGDLGWPTEDVVLIAADRFDPQKFTSNRFAEAFWRTDIPLDAIEAGLWTTVQQQHFAFGSNVIEERAAYRRTARRRGAERGEWMPRGAAVSLPAEERERRRRQYINEVLEALEEKRGF